MCVVFQIFQMSCLRSWTHFGSRSRTTFRNFTPRSSVKSRHFMPKSTVRWRNPVPNFASLVPNFVNIAPIFVVGSHRSVRYLRNFRPPRPHTRPFFSHSASSPGRSPCLLLPLSGSMPYRLHPPLRSLATPRPRLPFLTSALSHLTALTFSQFPVSLVWDSLDPLGIVHRLNVRHFMFLYFVVIIGPLPTH